MGIFMIMLQIKKLQEEIQLLAMIIFMIKLKF